MNLNVSLNRLPQTEMAEVLYGDENEADD